MNFEFFLVALNNREKAVAIWLFVFLIWVLTKKEVRSSVLDVLKSIFLTKLSIIFLTSFIYIFSTIFLLYKIKFWDPSLIKDTLIWIFSSGLILLINVNKATGDTGFFKNSLKDSIKLSVALEFIMNLYTYSFLFEMIFIPTLLLIVAMNTLSGYKKEFNQIKKITDWLLSIVGIYTLIYTLFHLLPNIRFYLSIYNLHALLLPLILTILYLPFLYLLATYMAYETLFVRLNILVRKDQQLVRLTKQKIFALCLLNLDKLNKFVKLNNINFTKISNKNDITKMIDLFWCEVNNGK